MLIANTLKHFLSARLLRSTLLILFLALLGGCSTHSMQEEPAPQEKTATTSSPLVKEVNQQDPVDSRPQSLCVYETTKGIAEVTQVTEETVTFKFYPGDKHFNLTINEVAWTNITPGQELKAIARTPISGPCLDDEFELLTTVK
ncbi:hypothetical protein [Alkalimarinus alittae]|uniref:Uncharacterized protein n=1 Tax=Alkalimarinus alittae TaxID=2961619 RepID=A0ABY6N362_9ALTE|nr:hypothetical protein [Alkalimarinus alittae]UZE96474.1 hypothetical protein NKI27_01625 [Alkalimarinus alittae]